MSRLWAEPFLDILDQAGRTFTDIDEPIGRSDLEGLLGDRRIIAYIGHADASSLGQYTILVHEGNVGLAAGSTIVAIACGSASRLGRSAVSRGVVAYLGFGDDLFVYEDACIAAAPAMLELLRGVVEATSSDRLDELAEAFRDEVQRLSAEYLDDPSSVPGFFDDPGHVIMALKLMNRDFEVLHQGESD